MINFGAYLAEVSTETATSNVWSTILSFVPLVLLFGVFYFFIIRPQRKREKEAQEMLNAVKVGDKIVTIGGIYGRVVKATDEVITIEVGAERTQILIGRWAIRNVVGEDTVNDTSVSDR